MIYENILQTIGNTPLVKINRLNPNKNVNIFAKIEGNNPTGSIKDRIALKMIEQSEANKQTTQSIAIYNSLRPHLSCQMLTPNKMHQQQEIKTKRYKKRSNIFEDVLSF